MSTATQRLIRTIFYFARSIYINLMGIVVGLVGFYRDYRLTGPCFSILFYYVLINMYYFFHGKTPRWTLLHNS